MSLTLGIGPLARKDDAGELNGRFEGPAHLLWFHDVPKRVRALFGGETIVDTEGARFLHETRILPVYYVPRADVRFDLLEESDHSTHCPFKGDARYWSVRVGDRVAENAVWGYDEVVPGAPDLTGYVAVYFEKMDRWLEEDDEVVGHPRDPFHRVDVHPASKVVRVLVNGDVVAESDRPMLLFETGFPVRYYLPLADWRADALEPSAKTSICPYKGVANYYSVRTGSGTVEDLAWTYRAPFDESARIKDHVCVPQGNDAVEVEVTRR